MTTVGDFLLEGALDAKQVEAVLSSGKYKSWLCLNGEADGPEKCPKEQVSASSVKWENVLVGPPSFSVESGREVLDVLEKMEKPAVIQCSTATRASAALVLYLAKKQGCGATGALQMAEVLNLKVKDAPQPMKNWIANCLDDKDDIIFRQYFDTAGSATYTYLLADKDTKEALLIDPVLEMVDRDLAALEKAGLTLKYCLNTHCHADHITGSGEIKKKLPGVQSMIAKASEAAADVLLAPGDKVTMGAVELEVRATPGHTAGCVSYVTAANGGMVFTGDALLINGCGRTDFQGGSSADLYESVHTQIFTLPSHYKVYPAHDYKGLTSSIVAEEKAKNPRLTKSKEEFMELMGNLNLPYPKKIDASLPANLKCGIVD